MINELIEQLVAKVGLDAGTAEKALSALFGLLQKEGDGAAVSALFDKLPGAADLAAQFGEGGGGALLGGLANAASGLLGDKAGDAMSAFAAMQEAGVDMDQAKSMLPVVSEFISEKAGPDVLKNALESVPALKDLLG